MTQTIAHCDPDILLLQHQRSILEHWISCHSEETWRFGVQHAAWQKFKNATAGLWHEPHVGVLHFKTSRASAHDAGDVLMQLNPQLVMAGQDCMAWIFSRELAIMQYWQDQACVFAIQQGRQRLDSFNHDQIQAWHDCVLS